MDQLTVVALLVVFFIAGMACGMSLALLVMHMYR
jgi:hypothetical protein